MPLSIRKAVEKDIPTLCTLMEQLSGHAVDDKQMLNRLQMIEESKIDFLYVCEEDGEILGLLSFRIRENVEEVSRFGEISAIVVNKEKRKKGVGKFMMDYAENLAHEMGCIGTWLVSGFGREEEAHKFYKSLGYKINGYRFVKRF
ncbi:MAG TPA: GNAT family N-acetyltransferase [Pseudobacteroides sp.]|nr:GNAT family N-acetyltransferase [Pseudobacteroides sp.]